MASVPRPDRPATSVALYLHGGTVHSQRPVTRTAATFQRARWVCKAIGPSLLDAGIASVLLRYTVRGWNAKDGEPAPLADAQWALDQVTDRWRLPIILVGHSMGARTGLHVAAHPNVIGLVALAPWFPADDPIDGLRGRHLSVLHGTHDRITSPRESAALAQRSEAVTASTHYIPMPGLGHYLLTSAADWHRTTRSEVLRIAEASRQTVI